MKTTFYTFALAIFFSAMIACNDDDNNSQPGDGSAPVGTWNWVESSGGFLGTTETPESTGNTIQLVISQTTVKKFTNGNMVFESGYTVETLPSIFGEERPMLVYENDTKQSFEIVSGKLHLNEECADCFSSIYAPN